MKQITIGSATFRVIRQNPDKVEISDQSGDRFIVLKTRLRNMGIKL